MRLRDLFRRRRDPILDTLPEFLLANAMVERRSNYGAPARIVTGEAAVPEWAAYTLHQLRGTYGDVTLETTEGATFGPVDAEALRVALRAVAVVTTCPACGQTLPPGGGAARADA